VRVGKLLMSAVFRRQATDETQGFMKVLVGANDDRILGFTMICADAGEVMAVMIAPALAAEVALVVLNYATSQGVAGKAVEDITRAGGKAVHRGIGRRCADHHGASVFAKTRSPTGAGEQRGLSVQSAGLMALWSMFFNGGDGTLRRMQSPARPCIRVEQPREVRRRYSARQMVACGSNDNEMFLFDATTGCVRWRLETRTAGDEKGSISPRPSF
jgi:hypothetical protein